MIRSIAVATLTCNSRLSVMLQPDVRGNNAKPQRPKTATDDIVHMLNLNRAPSSTYTSLTHLSTPHHPNLFLHSHDCLKVAAREISRRANGPTTILWGGVSPGTQTGTPTTVHQTYTVARTYPYHTVGAPCPPHMLMVSKTSTTLAE